MTQEDCLCSEDKEKEMLIVSLIGFLVIREGINQGIGAW